MKVEDLPLKGLKLITLDLFKDDRGFFVERFHRKRFSDHGLPADFFQDNFSRSIPGVLRGLHYQFDPPQGKLVGVTRGRIWDVAVDIRSGSPTFGQHFGVELSGETALLFWIPAGFAHGFCVLGDEPADLIYKVDHPYNSKGENGIAWNDPDLKISWPVQEPLVSPKDAQLISFRSYREAPSF